MIIYVLDRYNNNVFLTDICPRSNKFISFDKTCIEAVPQYEFKDAYREFINQSEIETEEGWYVIVDMVETP